MTDYASMTDEQIDRAVAEILGWRAECYRGLGNAPCARLLSSDGDIVDHGFVIQSGQDVTIAWQSLRLPRWSTDLHAAYPLLDRLWTTQQGRILDMLPPGDSTKAARAICVAVLEAAND